MNVLKDENRDASKNMLKKNGVVAEKKKLAEERPTEQQMIIFFSFTQESSAHSPFLTSLVFVSIIQN